MLLKFVITTTLIYTISIFSLFNQWRHHSGWLRTGDARRSQYSSLARAKPLSSCLLPDQSTHGLCPPLGQLQQRGTYITKMCCQVQLASEIVNWVRYCTWIAFMLKDLQLECWYRWMWKQLYVAIKYYVISQSAIEGLVQLVKVGVRPQELPEFFWRHLERDIELLGRAIGKSMDDSAITLHLVLKEILLRDPPTCEN